jgi:hypothetical protein
MKFFSQSAQRNRKACKGKEPLGGLCVKKNPLSRYITVNPSSPFGGSSSSVTSITLAH